MAVLCSQDQYFFEAPGALRQSIFKISLRYLRLVQNSTQNDWDSNDFKKKETFPNNMMI